MNNGEWKIVVEPMPRAEAEHALADWLNRQVDQGTTYRNEKVRMDVIWSKDRQHLVRYAVQIKSD